MTSLNSEKMKIKKKSFIGLALAGIKVLNATLKTEYRFPTICAKITFLIIKIRIKNHKTTIFSLK